MDQSTFVSRVASRLNIDGNDPLYDHLDGYVNDALHMLETSAPEGWPWYRRTLTLTTTAGTSEYTFSTLGALVTPSVGVSRILDCSVLYDSNYYFPMDLVNPEDATRMFGSTQRSIPEAWYAEGQTLYLYPSPDAARTIKVRVVFTESDLGGGSSTPILPTVFHNAVVDQTLLIAYQALQDDRRMMAQQGAVDRWIDRMRLYGSEYAAAPRITVRDPLWT